VVRRIVIDQASAGRRLDELLSSTLGLSRAQVRRLIEAGAVRHNGKRARKGQALLAGDELAVDEARLHVSLVADPALPLLLRHEDAHLVIADKPTGMPSHPLDPGEQGCLANALLARFPEMAHVGYDARQAGLVNRLDNDTSGLVLAARTAEAFTQLRELLRAGAIHKRYLALTVRELAAQDIRLSLAPRGARVAVVPESDPEGRVTHTRVLGCRAFGQGRFLVELEAAHAYRHQVRVHLAHLGAPLVGDALYGGEPGAHHHLHASRIAFRHPFTGEQLCVESPLPPAWDDA
jgi:23S rRNA pseudouridine1911/1915/1917 synthase